MPYKIRVQKKKESAPFRLVSRSEEMIEQVRSNPKWIWGGIGIVVGLTLVILAFTFFNYQSNQKAWALESEASKLFHEPPPLPEPVEEGKEPPKQMDKTERLRKSASLYDEIVEKYPRTASAPVALYEAGNVFFELKEYDQAEKRYQAFLDKYSGKKNLVPLVHLKLGYLGQAKGDEAAASKHFRVAYEMESSKNRDQAGFELARGLEKMEKKTEAGEIYKKVSEDFKTSPWGTEAKVRLDILNPPAATAPAAPQTGTNLPPPPAATPDQDPKKK